VTTVPDAEHTQPVPIVRQTAVPDSTVPDSTAEPKRRFGGIRWGSAFFGWVTAMGTALLLSAVGAVALGLAMPAGGPALGVAGAVVVLVVLLVAYYCGGYVAGRMARFTGAKQGLAVWLWALPVAVILAIAGSAAGVRLDTLAGGLPRIPVVTDALTTGGVALGVGALVASLVGAVLGGMAGMRYNRKVDRDLVAWVLRTLPRARPGEHSG
jgi:hypothetical protein